MIVRAVLYVSVLADVQKGACRRARVNVGMFACVSVCEASWQQ